MIALLGCAWIDAREALLPYDRDQDGIPWQQDCDDQDPGPCPYDSAGTFIDYPDTPSDTGTVFDPGNLPVGAVLRSAAANDAFGAAISAGEDVTHDGVPDLLIGAPGTGQAWFVERVWTADNYVGNIGVVLGSGGDCGAAVLLAPDVDGDSLGEALVACPSANVVERWWPGGDRRGTWLLPAAPRALAGVGPKMFIGVPDLGVVFGVPVGAYGEVDLADGISGLRLGDAFGAGLVTGDFEGIGAPQLVVLAPNAHAARVDLFTQPFPMTALDAAGTIALGAKDDLVLASAGDVDGDGVGDLVVGEPNVGTVSFFRAPRGEDGRVDAIGTYAGPGEGFGATVAGPGDVDGDGWDDLIVGDPAYREGAGGLWVLHGPIGVGAVDAYYGPEGAAVGTSLAGTGDRDQDGLPDVVVAGRDGEHGKIWLLGGGSL